MNQKTGWFGSSGGGHKTRRVSPIQANVPTAKAISDSASACSPRAVPPVVLAAEQHRPGQGRPGGRQHPRARPRWAYWWRVRTTVADLTGRIVARGGAV